VSKTLRIATRGSNLALWQARHVRERLLAVDPSLSVELVPMKTRGDKILDVPLAKVGGKALFVREVERALLVGHGDIAVHSMKDVPTDEDLEPGLTMAAISSRANPFDALCSRGARLAELPRGARVGTSSLRRGCQLKALRPDLEIGSVRGNVETRLAKLDSGEFDAVVLAAAGLERLGLAHRMVEQLEPPAVLPAVAQGALGIEVRETEAETIELVRRAMHDREAAARVTAERAFLSALRGACQTPIAAYAVVDGATLWLRALVSSLDGTEVLRGEGRGPVAAPAVLGQAVADELLAKGARAILDACIAALT
jgi:hydroxymethylbilane synthase